MIEIEVVEALAFVEVVVVVVVVEGLVVVVVSSGNIITPVIALCFCTPNFCGDGSLCPCGKSSHLCPPGCCCCAGGGGGGSSHLCSAGAEGGSWAVGASDNQTDISALFKLCTFAVFMLNTCVFLAAWIHNSDFGVKISRNKQLPYFESEEYGD